MANRVATTLHRHYEDSGAAINPFDEDDNAQQNNFHNNLNAHGQGGEGGNPFSDDGEFVDEDMDRNPFDDDEREGHEREGEVEEGDEDEVEGDEDEVEGEGEEDIEVGSHGSINDDGTYAHTGNSNPNRFQIDRAPDAQSKLRPGDPAVALPSEAQVIEYEPFWKTVVFAFIPKDKSQVRPWLTGVFIDCIFMICLVSLIIAIYHDKRDKIREAWYFPFLGCAGAIISTSTPAGGGVVFFPFLTLLNYEPQEAAAFSMAVQSISMGVFGAIQWARTAPPGVVVYWMIFVIVAGSWGGVITSLELLPINNDGALRTFFLIFIIFLALYILYGLVFGGLQKQNSKVQKRIETIIVFLLFGFIGGMMVGYIAVGIDILFFIVLTLFYKTSSDLATVCTIFIMGWACWLPALILLITTDHVRVNFVLMTLIGSLIGARIGPALNVISGRKNVLIAFEVLLLIEILRTIGELFLAPLVFEGSSFFWEQ